MVYKSCRQTSYSKVSKKFLLWKFFSCPFSVEGWAFDFIRPVGLRLSLTRRRGGLAEKFKRSRHTSLPNKNAQTRRMKFINLKQFRQDRSLSQKKLGLQEMLSHRLSYCGRTPCKANKDGLLTATMICFKNEGQREVVRFLAVNFIKKHRITMGIADM